MGACFFVKANEKSEYWTLLSLGQLRRLLYQEVRVDCPSKQDKFCMHSSVVFLQLLRYFPNVLIGLWWL